MTNAAKHRRNLSDITTPPISPTLPSRNNSRDLVTTSSNKKLHHRRPKPPVHETIHAQSLLLGFAFMAIWSPQNCMAPNLTEMASDFGFSDAKRDFYLGANIALATGVLSLPISAGIGILADVWNRKYLFCATVALGGVSSYLTGISRTYRALFWARLLNGAFMSGSVPVAFSLLGDLFNTSERNAASSGLTAMMGLGIILGQVYAGVVGSSLGWPHPFYVSAIVTLISAFLVLLLVKEPVRGGKEEVLQDMLKRGTRYERKLTWSGFVQTMRNNESNMILMWQGFFSSVPWGIIFVFLNDYLSQERGFSVPDATYLVAVFGVGCAVGGILGGYWGGIVQSWNRSYLPLFMALTTLLGIFPFLGLLNGTFRNAHGLLAVGYSFLGGSIASLPSVCVRPCLINVNPPETRGAALTAANLIIQLARGAGPSCITLLGAILKLDRQFSFNVTVSSENACCQ
jgi:translation initiation factor 4G